MYKCNSCGEEYTSEDLKELRQMGERYWLDFPSFICPDCLDTLQRKDLEDQLEELLRGW